MSAYCGLAGRKTNYSLRRTTANILLNNNISDNRVSNHLGHRNLQSLENYREVTFEQDKEVSGILTSAISNKRTSDTLPTVVTNDPKKPKLKVLIIANQLILPSSIIL